MMIIIIIIIVSLTHTIKRLSTTISQKHLHQPVIVVQKHLVLSVVYAARLTGWVKLREIWQLNFWSWILQAEENNVRIQYSIKMWTPLRSFYSERFVFSHVFAHSRFANAYHFSAFPILIFCGIAFRI